MREQRTHRSYVSYIDKSRRYYRAQGYANAYAWAYHDDVPFGALPKPLSECRIGVGTTADRWPRAEGLGARLYAEPLASANSLHTEMFWDRDATHTDDPETYLPLGSLAAHSAAGRFLDLSPRFYGLATAYSQRQTVEEDAPRTEAWMREDGVDAAILVAL